MRYILFLTALLCLMACEAYKILVIFPVPGKSHAILGSGIVNQLLKAGHEVTYIQGLPMSKGHLNLTEIRTKPDNSSSMGIESILDQHISVNTWMGMVMALFSTYMSGPTVEDENVQKLLKDPTQKFDLIIAEWLASDLYCVFQAIYKCPFIWFSSLEPHWQILRLIDEPLNPAYNSDLFSSEVAPYSFGQRAIQLWIQLRNIVLLRISQEFERRIYNNKIVPILEERGEEVPAYSDLLYNASLMFGNSHVSMGVATRLPQSYKPIGGYHIDREVKPLPDDLKKILDNAKDGLIYFSMGSNIESKTIPQVIKDKILEVFGELKQTVLWKFEEVLPNLPKNVHIVTWAPQQSILAHPNTILFISHGGLLSTTEAIHFGKPLIGIPIFGDQQQNVDLAVKKGYGRRVDLAWTMDEVLRREIQEVLGNPTYAKKAKEWSLIYHDRPVHPADEIAHWAEHVIKTGGAPHLRSAALLVPWYQKLYLDLLLVLAIFLYVFYKVLKIVFKWRQSTKNGTKKKTD